MSWSDEFGHDYEVPRFLSFLANKKILEDSSWHNDISPSFSLYRESGERSQEVRLWVDHPFMSARETGGQRYVLVVNTDNDQVFESNTDDLDDALAVLFNKLAEFHKRIQSGPMEWRPDNESVWDDPIGYLNDLKNEYVAELRAY
jgi:hypothetical protein